MRQVEEGHQVRQPRGFPVLRALPGMEQELGRVGGGDTHYETGFKNSKDTENFFINDSRCQKVTRSRRNCCKTTRLRIKLRRRRSRRQRRRRVDLIRGQTRGDMEFKVEDAIKTHSATYMLVSGNLRPQGEHSCGRSSCSKQQWKQSTSKTQSCR